MQSGISGLHPPRMHPFSSTLLLLFFFTVLFGEPMGRYVSSWSPQDAGVHSNPTHCLERKPSSGKTELKSMPAVPCWRRGRPAQLWEGISLFRRRGNAAPQRSLLVDREKDLSTYNWNSFGLRYGKRQAGVEEANVKIW
ncbi:PREDICTED: metastasis-suppressor KiSS-1 [Gavialis gangeticus]|uniref:metastasis-suppressor KiSS-1 n=1 Tax=Gavialis gangeticus TaxID=94835 RepID=UPI00092F41C2|nr:PREDICTED: metastasis-suppressor KiSS-1 [Gavialis gangeticus]